jgi:hypothetical protein
MRNVLAIVLITVMALAVTTIAQDHAKSTSPASIEPLPRDIEIKLALSALPPHLRDGATVYVLNPAKGFEIAQNGTNGFRALVARTGDDMFRGSWPLKTYRDDILYPIGFDPAGANAQLHVFLDAAEMQAKGTPPEELKKIIQKRYQSGVYKAPERAGVAYMLSPILRTYTNPDQDESVLTLNVPHVMYYSPNVTNKDVGGGMPGPTDVHYLVEHRHWPGSVYPFVILNGPHGYTVQFLGAAEREVVTKEYQEMLTTLCKLKDAWCLPKSTP